MKILIVEDEVYSRKSLVKQVKAYQSSSPIEILEASNGKKALELYEEHHPELILSDIKMPFVGGLELLKLVLEKNPQAKVIMISGYADFQYAQEAINAGAAGYLLKPVEDRKLYDSMEKALQQNLQHQERTDRLNLLQHTDTLSKYIYDTISSGTIHQEYVIENIFERILTEYRVIDIFFAQKNYPDELEFQTFLQNSLGKSLNVEFRIIMVSQLEWLIVIREYDELLPLIQKVNSYMEQHNWSYCIGISSVQDTVKSLLKAYGQAKTALCYKLLEKNKRFISYDDMIWKHPVNYISFESWVNLKHYLSKGDVKGTFSIMKKELDKLLQNRDVSITCYENLMLKLTTAIQETAGTPEDRLPYSEISINLNNYDNTDDLLDAVYQLIEYACARVTPGKNTESNIIDRVISYINQNYNKDLSLKELAETVFFMNHTYLSHLIRQKTGKNYSSYLREIRINKAKELLKDKSLSITEVANLSGYNDSSQFIQVFKKEQGMTPKKYRELL